jgi:hypothetical protein
MLLAWLRGCKPLRVLGVVVALPFFLFLLLAIWLLFDPNILDGLTVRSFCRDACRSIREGRLS